MPVDGQVAVIGGPALVRVGSGRALLRGARPRQWVKSVLVAAAPIATGELLRPRVLLATVVAAATFAAVSSGVYFLNDVADRDRDRQHPRKRLRPVASGALSVPVALAAGTLCVLGGLGAALLLSGWALVAVLAAYLVVTLGYSAGLKRVPVLELAVLAGGFVFRPLAGAAATHLAPSRWFLAVICTGALTLAAGKRYAEVRNLGVDAAVHRPALGAYSARGLRRLRSLSILASVGFYLGWAMSGPSVDGRIWETLSALPLGFAMFRYAERNEAGEGEAPELLFGRDGVLLAAGCAWLALFVAGVPLH